MKYERILSICNPKERNRDFEHIETEYLFKIFLKFSVILYNLSNLYYFFHTLDMVFDKIITLHEL